MGTYHEVNRYIDADELVQWFMSSLEDYLMENPEDVTPVIHAHWIRWREPKVTNSVYKCSNCGFDITVDESPNIDIGFWIEDFRYCLHCGAKMDEKVVEE